MDVLAPSTPRRRAAREISVSAAHGNQERNRAHDVHVEGGQHIVHRNAPAAWQSLALAHGPRFDDVEKAKRGEDGERQRPGVPVEEIQRSRHGPVADEEFTDPDPKTERHGGDFVQHDGAGVGLIQNPFGGAAKPDGQKNSGARSYDAPPDVSWQQQDHEPEEPDKRTKSSCSEWNPAHAEAL